MADYSSEGNPLQVAPDEDDQRTLDPICSYVVEKFKTYRTYRLPLETKWNTYYRIYRCLEDGEDGTKDRRHERSRIKVPASKEAVTDFADAAFQIATAEPAFSINPLPPDTTGKPIELAAMEMGIKHEQAKTVKAYISYLHDRENRNSKLHLALVELGIYGTTVAMIEAKEKKNIKVRRTTPPPTPVIGEDGQQLDSIEAEEQVERVEQRVVHPETKHIPLECFYTNTNANGVQRDENSDGCIVRTYKKRFELYDIADKETVDGLSSPPIPEVKQRRFSHLGLALRVDDTDVELLEFWGWIDNDTLAEAAVPGLEPDPESGGRECVVIVANREVVIKAEPNPHASGERPFIVARYEKIPNEFYGLGIIEVSQGPQKALDATVRARIDNKALSLNQIFGINVDKFIPGQNLTLYPGKSLLFRGDPRESFFPLQVPDVTSSSYNEAQEYERYIQKAHGISPLLGGQAAKRGEQTATEVSMLMGQSNSRIKTLVANFEKDFIVPALKWYVRIILQFINDEEIFSVTDSATGAQTLHKITPADVTEDFDFVALGSVSINAQADAQKRLNFLQITANPVDAPMINRPYLLKKVYESLGLDDEEQAFMQQNPMSPQGMMSAQAAGGPPPGVPGMAPPMEAGAGDAGQPGSMLMPSSVPGGMPSNG